jgi:hypothetical protein
VRLLTSEQVKIWNDFAQAWHIALPDPDFIGPPSIHRPLARFGRDLGRGSNLKFG